MGSFCLLVSTRTYIVNMHRRVGCHNKDLGIVAYYLELWGCVRFVNTFIKLKPHMFYVVMVLQKAVQMQ